MQRKIRRSQLGTVDYFYSKYVLSFNITALISQGDHEVCTFFRLISRGKAVISQMQRKIRRSQLGKVDYFYSKYVLSFNITAVIKKERYVLHQLYLLLAIESLSTS